MKGRSRRSLGALAVATVLGCGASHKTPPPSLLPSPGCPSEMARIVDGTHAYCIDRWEASLVEVAGSSERDLSPFETVGKRTVRAVSRAGVVPQAYLSRNEAANACKRSDKRLCTEAEWVRACAGPRHATFPYGGSARKPGACNDQGRAPLSALANVLPPEQWERMNDPRLNQVEGSVAKTGSHAACASPEGVYDLVGNLHEWVDDPEGTFLGGYYLDTTLNGPGCRYKTVAHGAVYHDYSTGFRCCKDASP